MNRSLMGTRVCSRHGCIHCGQPQPVANFGPDKRKADGLNPNCKDCCRAYLNAYRKRPSVKEKLRAAIRAYNQRPEVKARQRAAMQQYLKTPKSKAYWREYQKRPHRKMANGLRNRLNNAVRATLQSKSASAVRHLGCTIPELIAYLEAKFLPGMSWDNWSLDGWHIDHVKPLASFDLSDPAQAKAAVHYTNLQPLWAADNLAKGDSVAA